MMKRILGALVGLGMMLSSLVYADEIVPGNTIEKTHSPIISIAIAAVIVVLLVTISIFALKKIGKKK